MKYSKVNYSIIGRFTNGRKFNIASRLEVSGYTVEGMEDIGIRKSGSFWYVDHIPTGLAIVTIGSATRDAATKEYMDHFAESLKNILTYEKLRDAVELFENTPLESDIEKWQTVNFCTTRNWRFDKITSAAKRAGLVIQKADDISYQDGGNINISGNPAALEEIRNMIEEWNKKDVEQAERQEIISNNDTTNTEGEIMENTYTFTSETVTVNGKEYPAEYAVTNTSAVVVVATTGIRANGRKEKQRFLFDLHDPDYPAALAAATGKEITEAPEPDAGKTFLYPAVIYTFNFQPEPAQDPELKTTTPEPAQDPKAAHGPVPEKTFIGDMLQGNGWMILFDKATERTRVIFNHKPSRAVINAVKDAGFYWSPSMGSWNKKLTFKAYRAAQKLAAVLDRMMAA